MNQDSPEISLANIGESAIVSEIAEHEASASERTRASERAASKSKTTTPSKRTSESYSHVEKRKRAMLAQPEFFRLYMEMDRELASYERSVREGRNLGCASDFAKLLLFSGLVSLFEKYSCEGPMAVNGPLMRWRCGELQRSVRDWQAHPNKPKEQDQTEIDTINRKLDLLAGAVSRLVK